MKGDGALFATLPQAFNRNGLNLPSIIEYTAQNGSLKGYTEADEISNADAAI